MRRDPKPCTFFCPPHTDHGYRRTGKRADRCNMCRWPRNAHPSQRPMIVGNVTPVETVIASPIVSIEPDVDHCYGWAGCSDRTGDCHCECAGCRAGDVGFGTERRPESEVQS